MGQENRWCKFNKIYPGLSNVSRQGKIFDIVPKKAYPTSTYSDKKTLEFTIELVANTHRNYSSMCIVLPIQTKKSTDKTANINVITVNNFFLSLVKRNWCKTLSRQCKNFTNK